MVGNLGQKPNSDTIVDAGRPAKKGLEAPSTNSAKAFTRILRRALTPAAPQAPPQSDGQEAPHPAGKLPPCQRPPRVGERLCAPTGLRPPLKAPQRIRLRGQGHPVLFQQRQLHRQQPLPGPEPLNALPLVGMRLLQFPPLGYQRPSLAEHLLIVGGRLDCHQVGELSPERGPTPGLPRCARIRPVLGVPARLKLRQPSPVTVPEGLHVVPHRREALVHVLA